MVTGCSGFLGYHIVKHLLAQEHEVVGVDKRPMTKVLPTVFIQTDVNDLTYRDLMGMDYIIHLAWRTNIPDCSRHPEDSTRQNIDMTIHLLEVAKEAKVKKVFFPSTASQYGKNPTPWTEDMVGQPIEHYSWQKLSCEIACKMYANSLGLDTVVGRFFQVYGEHQREDTALAAFIKARKTGKPITLTETTAQSSFKSGQRDFVYAGDLAWAVEILLLSDTEPGGVYNVGSGKITTMEDVANAVGGEVQWIPRREWEVERHEADITKLKELGWIAQTEVIKWIEDYIQTQQC